MNDNRVDKQNVTRRVLLITGKDVHNKGTFKIYREFIRRGFHVDVYATTLADKHTLLFQQEGVEIKNVKELNEQHIETYDYIFSAVPLFGRKLFRECHKYIFMNPSTHFDEVYFTGDFNFTIRDISQKFAKDFVLPIEEINYYKSIPAMASGGAALVDKKYSNTTSNKILFIDAGHFPFGTKKELAEYIITIAEACFPCELKVKPRYLPMDTETSHTNKENVLLYLADTENLPSNLKIINEHTDFQQELEDCDLVICSEGTTSYEEVILAKKRLLIFTGFPNQENVLWSQKRIEWFNYITNHIINRVYYKDIYKYLPYGIETNIADLKNNLYSTSNVAENIVDVMEHIYVNCIINNKFPARDYYKIESYKEQINVDKNLHWDDIIQRRYKSLLYDEASHFISRLYVNIDFSELIGYIESQYYTEKNIDEKSDEMKSVLFDIFIENDELLRDTEFWQSVLCMAYFKKGRFKDFILSPGRHLAYYDYCLAKEYFDKKDFINAYKYINDYFDSVELNLYEISYADDEGVKIMAHYYRGAILFHLGEYKKAKEDLTICDKAWEGRHKKAKEYLNKICNLEQCEE